MFNALSVCRMTRLFVLRWWKRTLKAEEPTSDDRKRRREVLTVIVELIEELEGRLYD